MKNVRDKSKGIDRALMGWEWERVIIKYLKKQ